jgi:Berberine and berberine like
VVPVGIPFSNFTAAEPVIASYLTHNLTQALRNLAPHMGCYVNEADANEPNYEQAFWGDHYPRLLAIKEKVDPHGVMWCKVCVGGSKWTVQSDGSLCQN